MPPRIEYKRSIHQKCRPFLAFLAAFLALRPIALGESIEVDVGAWADMGTGETNGWKVNGIGRTAEDGLTRLRGMDDYALSPKFDFDVTQLVMAVRCSSAEARRYLTITPVIARKGATKHTVERSLDLSEQVFAWDPSEGVRQFRLQNDTGESTSSWGISALTVYTGKISAPSDLHGTVAYRDAFVAAWTPDARAVSHEIEVGRVHAVPPNYEVVSEWDFTSLTNTSGNSKGLEVLREEFPAVLCGVSGENLGLQGRDGGHLQIGKDNVAGSLILRLDASAAARTCRITTWRHPKDTSAGCSAFCLDEDGRTNSVVALAAAASPATDVFAVPDESALLRVESSKSRRIEVSSVIVVTNYVEGSVSTDFFGSWRTSRPERTVRGLFPGEWAWRARSLDAENVESAWSPFSYVSLDPASPPRPRPGCSVQIR